MYVRNTAIAFVASGLMALSTTATASPLPPDPPSRHTTSTVQIAIDQLKEDYIHAQRSQQRGIRNEVVLLMHLGRAAL